MVIFYSGTPRIQSKLTSMIVLTSLGNIGAARPACNSGRSTIYLNCANGYFDKLTDFGMVNGTNNVDCLKEEKFQFNATTDFVP